MRVRVRGRGAAPMCRPGSTARIRGFDTGLCKRTLHRHLYLFYKRSLHTHKRCRLLADKFGIGADAGSGAAVAGLPSLLSR